MDGTVHLFSVALTQGSNVWIRGMVCKPAETEKIYILYIPIYFSGESTLSTQSDQCTPTQSRYPGSKA